MNIDNRILRKINMVEGEKITQYIDIVYEFLLDQNYIRTKKKINSLCSSLELANYLKYITGAEVSNLDVKYCMEFYGIEGKPIGNDGLMYYPLTNAWIEKIKHWSMECCSRFSKEAKYRRMKEDIDTGNSNYIVI